MKNAPIRFAVETVEKEYENLPFAIIHLDRLSTDSYLTDRKIFSMYRGEKFSVTTVYKGRTYEFNASAKHVIAEPVKKSCWKESAIMVIFMSILLFFLFPRDLLTENVIIISIGVAFIIGQCYGQFKINSQREAADKFNESKV